MTAREAWKRMVRADQAVFKARKYGLFPEAERLEQFAERRREDFARILRSANGR